MSVQSRRQIKFYVGAMQGMCENLDCLKEHYHLLLKSAIRCMRDLDHCVAFIDNAKIRNLFSKRLEVWGTIFSPDGMRDYKHRLHNEIRNLEMENAALKKVLAEAGIPMPIICKEDKDIPF